MTAARFRSSEVTRAIKAARAAGETNFDVAFDHEGRPIIRVRRAPANDTPQEVNDEIEAWAREQQESAA